VSTRIGAVDIGTNSVRLLVAEPVTETDGTVSLRPIDRLMRITRLGQGVHAARALAPEAVDRTVAVLEEYGKVARSLGVERMRATATSAARDASNREDFFDRAERALGVRPECISGEEEAALSFAGATAGLRAPGPYLVVDVGGGSTEFVYGTDRPLESVSVDMGCVRLSEAFLESDPPAAEELANAVQFARDLITAEVEPAVPHAREARTIIGLAGTMTTMAAVELGLPEYDPERIHHFVLTKAAAEDVFRTLATEKASDRAQNPGLEPGRVDVIVGGVVVVVTLMRSLGYDEILVSEADILDGLIRSQL